MISHDPGSNYLRIEHCGWFRLLVLVCLLLSIAPPDAFASMASTNEVPQHFIHRIHEYNRSDGFNATMIKSLLRTSDGLLFVGCDQQFLVNHGDSWTSIALTGNQLWIKDMLYSHDGVAYVLSDGQLGQVVKKSRDYEIITLVDAGTDPDFRFGKKLFEASDGALWIACDETVFRFQNGKLEKYAVPYLTLAHRNYLHAYHFLEKSDGAIYLVSFIGESFYIDREQHLVSKLAWNSGNRLVTSVFNLGRDRFLIGTDTGLFVIRLDANHVLSAPEKILPTLDSVQAICAIDRDSVLVSDDSNRVFRVSNLKTVPKLQLVMNANEPVFRIITDVLHTTWLLTDSEFYSLFTMPFSQLDLSDFVQSMTLSESGSVLIAQQNQLLEIEPSGSVRTVSQFDEPVRHILSNGQDYWVSLADGRLVKLDHDGVPVSELHLEAPVVDMIRETSGRLWAVLEGARRINRILENNQVEFLSPDLKANEHATGILLRENGEIYATGDSVDHFLHHWDEVSGEFVNVGRLVGIDAEVDPIDFAVNEIKEGANGEVLVATTLGVLKYQNGVSSWMKITGFPLFDIHSIDYDPESKSYWMTIYNLLLNRRDGVITKYDHLLGLPLLLDVNKNLVRREDGLFILASGGEIYFRSNSQAPRLLSPILSNPTRSFEKTSQVIPAKLGDNQILEFEIISRELPKDLLVQHCEITLPDGQTMTKEGAGGSFIVRLNDLRQTGRYHLKIWTSSPGLKSDSVAVEHEFHVYSEWVHAILIYSSFSILLIVLVATFFIYRGRVQRQRILELDRLVAENTADLISKNLELKGSNQVRDRLFSVIAHDLRGSVGNMKMLLELIPDALDFQQTPMLKELLPALKSESNATYILLDNLLNWSRVQLGGIEVNMERVSMEDVFQEIVLIYENRMRQKNLFSSIQVDPGLYVNGDVYCLQTVVRNLVGNSVKFCNPGNSIKLSAHSISSSPEKVRVIVSDTGPGMKQETLEHLKNTSEFFTTRGSNGESGSGIGINLCFELLKLMGCELVIESSWGKGSTFSFELEKVVKSDR